MGDWIARIAALLVPALIPCCLFLWRYRSRWAFPVSLLISLASWALGIAFAVVFRDEHRAVSRLYPATEWATIAVSSPPVSRLEYREGIGVFVHAGDSDHQVTPAAPPGLPGHDLERYNRMLANAGGQVSVRANPPEEMLAPPEGHPLKSFALPPCPGAPIDTLKLLLGYPVDWNSIAIVGYALYSDGRILCSERYINVGGWQSLMDGFGASLADFLRLWVVGLGIGVVLFTASAVAVWERCRRGRRAASSRA